MSYVEIDHFDALADAENLHDAFKGAGTDEDKINRILSKRTLHERLEIRACYRQHFGKDLLEVLKSETSGDYQSLLITLFRNQIEILAYDLFRKMNQHVLNQILCCCNNTEMSLLKQMYAKILREEDPEDKTRSLESDVTKETKPPYEKLLLALLKGERKEDPLDKIEDAYRKGDIHMLVNKEDLEHDVRDLYQAGVGHAKKGDPDEFIRILPSRSKYHMKALWDLHKVRYGMTLVESISKTFSDPLRCALNTVIMAQINLRDLLVCQLHETMYGKGTDEKSLIRLIILRSEIDLPIMKRMYADFFGKPLHEAIRSDTSGDFRNLLLMIVEE